MSKRQIHAAIRTLYEAWLDHATQYTEAEAEATATLLAMIDPRMADTFDKERTR